MRMFGTTPTSSFDLTTADLDPRINFTRTGATATVVNSSGLIQAVAADTPRFDYNPITLACNGLLIEEARTNSLTYSEDFSAATGAWTNTRLASTTSSGTSPDGLNNANAVIEDSSASNAHLLERNVSFTAGTSYTFSCFFKANGRNWVRLFFSSTAFGSNTLAFFDCQNGVLGTTANTPATSIQNFGNGWYRFSISKTATVTASAPLRINLASADNVVTYSGNGTSGVYAYGAQLEAGAFPTSYIPTTTTAITRNADVATITGANFSGFWQAGKGSALVRARPGTVSGTRPWVQFDDTTANNIIALRGNTTNPELYIRSGGSDQAQIDAGTIAANVSYRLAGAWAANDCAASLNSGAAVRDGVATIPVVTQARLGSDGTNYLNGHLEAIEYYDERVLNASLQVVSSTAGYRSIIGPVFRDTIIS